MAEVLLFHHAQGQTPGFLAFADALRSAGHTVHAPDVYDGKTFATLDEGVGTPSKQASTRSSSAAGSPPKACRTSSSMPASRSV